jgi:hypothetical protein
MMLLVPQRRVTVPVLLGLPSTPASGGVGHLQYRNGTEPDSAGVTLASLDGEP